MKINNYGIKLQLNIMKIKHKKQNAKIVGSIICHYIMEKKHANIIQVN